MKLSVLLSAIGAENSIQNDMEITSLCYDSRKVQKGSLFVCLNGETTDGHKYAKNAEQLGACVIVAEHSTDSALPHIIVKDTREAIFSLASAWYESPEKKMKFIGVTGTNGKTSTVYYIKHILEGLGKKTGLIGTVANMIGDRVLPSNATTPEPLELMSLLDEMYKSGVEYVVMEVSSHSLVQKRVCGITFETAVFTNLTRDHLDYHKTMENYMSAKAELFRMSKNAVINTDDEKGLELHRSLDCTRYSFSTIYNRADFVAKDIKLRSSGVSFLAVIKGGIARVKVPSPGGFVVYNALGAIGAVLSLGFPFEQLIPVVANIGAVPGRAQIISGERPYTVMIDYAHTPDGLENIISSVREFKVGRLITLFGCGGDRDKQKRPMMGEIASRLSDYVIVTSDNPRTEDPDAIIADILPGVKKHRTPTKVITSRKEAIKYAIDIANDGDVVLLAGKGHEKYQILNTGKIDFDEEQIAAEFMEQKK